MNDRALTFFLSTLLLLLVGCQSSDAPQAPSPSPPPPPPIGSAQSFTNLSYATASNLQKLDLYLPATGTAPYPVVIWIHGGAWKSGDKTDIKTTNRFTELQSRGYAVASLNYRLSGDATFPAQIHDVKAAIRWLRAQATTYQLNPSKFGVWGSSAGGHLATLLGTSAGVTPLEDLAQGNPTQSSAVQVVIDWYGPTDLIKLDSMASKQGCTGSNHDAADSGESLLMGFPIQTNPKAVWAASPLSYIDSGDPPMFIEHGLSDCTVSYFQSQLLYDTALPLLGASKLKFKLLIDTGHGGNLFNDLNTVKECVDFLDTFLK